MKYKSIILLILAVFVLISIAGVNASEINDTAISSEDTQYNLQINENNQAIEQTDNDEILSVENDLDILNANYSTYSGLSGEISHGGNIKLQHEYYTYDSGDSITIDEVNTVIDGNGAVIDMAGSSIRAFTVSASDVTIKNLTIKNANYNGDGGAIYFNSNGSVENCNFINNHAENSGGAVYFLNEGSVTNCNFTGNNASAGSAIYFASDEDTKTVSNSYFINNRADAEDLQVTKNENNITITFTGKDNLLNAIYSGGDVNFTNVTYWGANGIANIGSSTPARSNKEAGQNITVEIYDSDDSLIENVTLVTDDNGQVVYSLIKLINGDYKYKTYLSQDCYYSYVETSGTFNIYLGDFNLLQRYLNRADANSVIILDRNYTFTLGSDENLADGIVIDKPITINGNGYTINALQKARIFKITTSNVVLTNITFANATTSGSGGAVYFNSNVNITNCNFINNSAHNNGCAVYCDGNGSTINMCSFTNNSAKSSGGAVYGCGDYFTINNCSFTNNSVKSDGVESSYVYIHSSYGSSLILVESGNVTVYGGAIYCSGNGCSVNNCNFTNNSVISYEDMTGLSLATFDIYGGAIYCCGNDFTINNCSFTSNSVKCDGFCYQSQVHCNVDIGGGAVYCRADNLLINDSNFTNNSLMNKFKSSTILTGCGGAIYCQGNNFSIYDCNFINNSAWHSGGAIYCDGNDDTINNCNFINNSAWYSGGAVCSKGNDCRIYDCNFTNNTAVCGGAVYFADDGNVFGSVFYKNHVSKDFVLNSKAFYPMGGAIYISGNGVMVNSKFYKNEAGNGSAIYSGVNALDLRDCEFIANKATAFANVRWSMDMSGYLVIKLDSANNYISAIYKENNNIALSNVTYWDGKIVNSDDGYPITKFFAFSLNLMVNGSDGNIYYNAPYTVYIENGSFTMPFDLSLANYPNGPVTFIAVHNDDYYNLSCKLEPQLFDRVPSSTRINTAESEFIYGNCSINFTTENTKGYYVVITNENGESVYEKINRSSNQQLDDPLISPTHGQGNNYDDWIFVDLPAGYYNMTVYGLGALDIRGSSDSKLFRILPLDSTISVDATEISLHFNDTVKVNATLDPADAGNLTYSSSNSSVVTVDANGNVHAVGAGKANVTVSLADNGAYAAESKVVSVDVSLIDLNWYYLNDFEWLNLDGAVITAPWNDFPKTSSYGSLPIGYEITIQFNDSYIIKSYVKDSEGNFDVNLTGISPGNYTATFSAYGYASAVAAVAVTQVDTEIIIDNPVVDLEVLDEVPAGATLTPADAGNLTYNVSNSSVAIVEDGKIKALAEGTAVITVSFAGDDKYAAAEDKTITVHVAEMFIAAYDVNMTYEDGSSYMVQLVDKNGAHIAQANEAINITINGRTYTRLTDENGIAKLTIHLNAGTYDVTAQYGKIIINNVVTVNKLPIVGYDVDMTYEDGSAYMVQLIDENGNPFAKSNEVINITINERTYTRYTNASGIAKVTIHLNASTYDVTAQYGNTIIHNTVTVHKLPIVACDVNMIYKDGSEYRVQLVDKDGNPFAKSNQAITITIAGKTYTRYTNASGIAKITINLAAGTYDVTAQYGDTILNNVVTVNRYNISASDVNMTYKDGSAYMVQLFDGNGDPVAKANVAVNITIDGRTYTRVTDENGVAKITINLRAGEYPVTAQYGNVNIENMVTVNNKFSISASDLVMDYKDGSAFEVQLLDQDGNPCTLAKEPVKITIAGKTYTRSTNENGIARIVINLAAGTYPVTTEYNNKTLSNTITVNKT